MNKRVTQYIAKYESMKSELENEDEELDTEMKALIFDVSSSSILFISVQFEEKDEVFITSFDSVSHAELMTAELINKFFMHFLSINSSSNVVIDFDSFSYIIIERYTCKKFYDIMINTDASKYSTTKYE